MHSSRAACCDHNRLCSGNRIISCLHIEKDRACCLAFLIFDDLYRRSKFYHRDLKVQYLVAECTHDLCSGVVLTCMHSLSGGTAAVGRYHPSVCVLVKHNAQFVQPFDRVRRFHYKAFYQFRLCSKMSASECVQIMLYRRIIFLICRLDTAFGHHRIRIANTEFCHDHYICACIVRFDGTGGTCAAAADHKHIYVIIHLRNVNLLLHKTACRVKHFSQFKGCFLSFVGAYFNLCKRIWIIIRMKFLQESIFFVSSQTSWFCRHTFCSCSLYLFDGFHHILWIWCIHILTSLISQSLLYYKAPASP